MENQTLTPVISIIGGVTLAKILEYFWVSWHTTIVFSIVLLLDFIFGVTAAYVCDKQSVTSTKGWAGIVRKITRFLLPFILIAALKGVGVKDTWQLTNVVFTIMIVTETYSIISNIYAINFKKRLPEIDVFEHLLRQVWKFLLGIINDPELKKPLDSKDLINGEQVKETSDSI